MLFKFDFDLEDEVDPDSLDLTSLKVTEDGPIYADKRSPEVIDLHPFQEINISHLLDILPPVISYSPFSIPLSSKEKSLVFARRDLFDARFQLISQSGDESSDLQFFDSPSDITPGVYEGGFKTWECSLDLVDYMENNRLALPTSLSGKRILEIGCGTAVPTIYILYRLLSSSPGKDETSKTYIHLQDYNASVLELITLPNLILTWFLSPAAAFHNISLDPQNDSANPPDLMVPSELNITPELKSAFLHSLQEHNIFLRFFSGSWETFNLDIVDPCRNRTPYDLVLTSETIYRTESLPYLVNLLRSVCTGNEVDQDSSQEKQDNRSPLCLIAAKVLYFGVGGSVDDFTRAAEERKGKVETAWETITGVKRKVLCVTWQ